MKTLDHDALTDRIISLLQRKKRFKIDERDERVGTSECTICLETIQLEDMSNGRNCQPGHVFHKVCLNKWKRHLMSEKMIPLCPICKIPI